MLELVSEILNKMGHQPIYLKFISDNYVEHVSRNEKIVIYTNLESQENDINNLTQIINAINVIKQEKPYLFDRCNIINPFIKKIEGVIGYAKEPSSDIYKFQNGNSKRIAQSYNSFLAYALEESLSLSMQDFSPSDDITSNDQLFTQRLNYLFKNYSSDLINNVKLHLAQCQEKNPDLEIPGLPKIKQR